MMDVIDYKITDSAHRLYNDA